MLIHCLQLSGFGEFVLLDVDGLGQDFVSGTLCLEQLEPVKVVEALATTLHLHSLGPGRLGPLLRDLVSLPCLANNSGPGRERGFQNEWCRVEVSDAILLTVHAGSIDQS
jgi:hypothetical protein